MILKIVFLLYLEIITSGMTKELNTNQTAFDSVVEWKFLEYEYDSKSREEQIMHNSRYDKKENLLLDFDVAEDGRIFVVVMKNKQVPSSLNVVSDKKGDGGPLLKPYPDWAWHSRNDCIGIFSVYKIQIDECNRLWVIDSGMNSSGEERTCPAQLLMFDLSSDKLQLRIAIPKEFFTDRDGEGYLANVFVQSDGWGCSNTNVLMSYFSGSGLVVWNGNKLWRLNGPDPTKMSGWMSINWYYVNAVKSIYGWSLSPKIDNKPQILTMRPVGTKNIFTIKLDDILATSADTSAMQFTDLSNLFNAIKPEPEKLNDDKSVNYTIYENVLPSTAASLSFNPQGILFLGLDEPPSIGCWNAAQCLTTDNIDVIDKDTEKLQWATQARVLQTSRTGNNEEELWIATNKYAAYFYNSIDWNETNFRILKQTTSSLLTNSKCLNSKSNST